MFALAVLLSACANLDDKSPDELLRYSFERNLTKDTQYNFDGKISFDAGGGVECGDANTTCSEVMPVSCDDAAFSGSRQESEDPSISAGCEDAASGETLEKQARKQRLLLKLSESISVPYTGAVDWHQGKMEVIPELRYEAKNVLLSVKMPVQVNLMDLSLVVDLPDNLIEQFMDKQRNGRLLTMQLPESMRKQIDMPLLMKALPGAVMQGYASVDKTAFQRLEMDEAGKQIGARYRVRMTLDEAQSNRLVESVIKSLQSEIQAAANTPANAQRSEEEINKIRSTAALFDGVAATYAEIKAKGDEIITLTDVQYDAYIDGRGRLLAVSENLLIGDMLHKITEGTIAKNAQLQVWMRLNYTDKPNFTLNATPQNSIGFEEWLKTERSDEKVSWKVVADQTENEISETTE